MVDACAAMYLGHTPAQDPGASPLYASLHGLPPLQLHVGRDEILLDDSLRYAERAADAGVAVALHVWDGMPHVFPNTTGLLEAADDAMALMAAFIATHLPRM
jgi:acetyl esterase/lipase